jgi:cob(II)yrinic acid a,c-diamide reductase
LGEGILKANKRAAAPLSTDTTSACGIGLQTYIREQEVAFGISSVLKKNDMGPQAYRDAMARFAGAVHIITTDGVAGRRGVTVIAACSVSDSPPTILACLNRENPNNESFITNGCFALNTLSADQEPLSVAFSGLSRLAVEKRFALGHWDRIETGAPTLVEAIAVFDCELIDTKDLHTHRVLFGKVTGLRVGDNLRPLLYHDRAYHVL